MKNYWGFTMLMTIKRIITVLRKRSLEKFKGENEMWKMPATERIHSNKNSRRSAVKRLLDYYASIILNYRNVSSGETLRLLHLKILSIFGST